MTRDVRSEVVDGRGVKEQSQQDGRPGCVDVSVSGERWRGVPASSEGRWGRRHRYESCGRNGSGQNRTSTYDTSAMAV